MAKDKEAIKNLKHYCYIICNLVNGKMYVGVTYRDLDTRFKEHVKVSRFKNNFLKQPINKAIAKYGKENFSIRLLKEFNNLEGAYGAEPEYIKMYKTKDANYGYNQSDGGDRGPINLKFDSKIIISVLKDFCAGVSLKQISAKHGIPYYSVFDISRLRISSLHDIPYELLVALENKKSLSVKKKRVTAATLVDIIIEFLEGTTMQELADKHKLSLNNVWNIVHRNTWKNVNIGEELELRLKKYHGQ